MDNFKFIVNCARISRQAKYIVSFPYNNQLYERIKSLPKEQIKYLPDYKSWQLTTKALFELIKSYKNSNKIIFDFGGQQQRDDFLKQIKKIDEERKEKERIYFELNKKKINSLKLKEDLEKNYLQYSDNLHKNLKPEVKLYKHQITGAIFANYVRNVLISHEMGLGKCQDLDSKLLTPKGWVRMGDIKVGDSVIGSDGKPKRVLGVYPQGLKDIYEIRFNDGVTARSCDEHLWNVNTYVRNWRKNPFMTKTLREIMNEGLQFDNGNNKWYVPIIKPIEFEKKKLKIDPYVLGCLLGDGSLTGLNNIDFCSTDVEIINEMSFRLPENHQLKISKNSIKKYYLTADGKNNQINRALKEFKLKGCNSYSKFIPDEYKFSSIQQRLEILQGILDTDGHSRKDSIVELTLASKQLINDVQFIVQSLGGIGRLTEKRIKYMGENRLYYRLHIKLPAQFIPFKLERKIKTFVATTKYPPNRAIVDVKYVGKMEAQCILIDSDDHLYCTDNCVLTHNSLLSIVFCEMNNFSKVFVITPNSLKFNYYNEVDKFTYSKAHILNWKKNQYTIEESKYIIVNYEFFSSSSYKNIVEKLKKLNIGKLDCLICDESSRIKNTKSNTYKNIKKIFVKAAFKDENPTKLFLSGTPMPNRANELYTTMNQIAPEDFPNKKHFYEYYCGMEYDPSAFGGWSRNPTKENLEELYKNISPYTHRKRKMDVLTDLPDKVYQKIILELASKEYSVYDSIEEGVANEYLNQETKNPLTIMLRLRQYTASLKSKIVIELIDRLLEEGDKVVVVDYFKESLQELKQHYGDIAGLHTGDITVEDRNTIVKDFQSENGTIKIFLGSIQTCSYGLTLTAANKLFVLTLPYSVGEYDQVSDRLHRIGQKDTVNIYPLIFRDTIDEYVFDAIESKRREIVKVMDNEEYVSKVSEALIYEVINKIVKKHGKKL